MSETCKTCRFFVAWERLPSEIEEYEGHCERFPRQHVGLGDVGIERVWRFPSMRSGDTCGEWAKISQGSWWFDQPCRYDFAVSNAQERKAGKVNPPEPWPDITNETIIRENRLRVEKDPLCDEWCVIGNNCAGFGTTLSSAVNAWLSANQKSKEQGT